MTSNIDTAKQELISLQSNIKKVEQQLQEMHLNAIFIQGKIAAYNELETASEEPAAVSEEDN